MKWVVNVTSMGDMRNAYSVLIGRTICRWEDNMRMARREGR
jgi:hypothetical protein